MKHLVLVIGIAAFFGWGNIACDSGSDQGGGPYVDILGDEGSVEDASSGDGGVPGDSGEADEVCVPDCEDKICGSDGCEGSCGDCGAGEL